MTVETRVINGRTYVRVNDLANQWHTTTSIILATGKPHHIPAQYRRTIDRQAWLDVEGLWDRIARSLRPSELNEKIWVWLLTQTDPESGELLKDRKEADRMKTMWENNSFLAECEKPQPEDIRHAMSKKQVLWRYKNNHIQVLAQTLSNYLGTRTSSLLAVNKKQGVPSKFIHRQWKRTWVDLEGLKQRVKHTEHGSALLTGLEQVIQAIDECATPDDSRVKSASASRKQAEPGTRQNPIDPCEVADEAAKLSTHNTERINKPTRDEAALENLIFSTRGAVSTDLGTQSKRVHNLDMRVKALEQGVSQVLHEEYSVKERVDRLGKQATQNIVNQTLLGDVNTRLGRLVSQADRLDAKTEGLVSRVSVMEDTTKWLSWSLAGVIGLRFVGLTLHWLRRK